MSVDLTKGDGTIKAGTNSVAGVDYPVVNVGYSTAGTAPTQVDATHGLPVALVAGSAVIGHVIVDSGTVTANLGTLGGAATAANQATEITALNAIAATVVGGAIEVENTGTFAVQAAQSGAWSISFTAPQHVIVDSGTITAVTAITNALPAGTNVIGHVIVDSGTITTVSAVTSITNAVLVKGGTASDAALANAPVTIGGRATNTNLAEMSADGDVVDAQFTMQGALVVAESPRELVGIQQTQISNSTTETTVVTAGASGVFNDISSISLANTGSAGTKVTLKDATSGTTRWIGYAPATDMRGIAFPIPIPQAAAAANWTLTCGTATTALEVTVTYIKRK